MPRPSKFTVLKLARPGGRSLFRIVIPARFTAEGKRKAVYYQTAAAAEADARTLRAMHTQGTIGLLSLLTPGAGQGRPRRAGCPARRRAQPHPHGSRRRSRAPLQGRAGRRERGGAPCPL